MNTGHQVIPEAAVEAAAKSAWEKEMNAPWSSVTDGFKAPFLRDARADLEAAAPHMLADAWDVGWEAGWDDCREDDGKTHNPYRPTP